MMSAENAQALLDVPNLVVGAFLGLGVSILAATVWQRLHVPKLVVEPVATPARHPNNFAWFNLEVRNVSADYINLTRSPAFATRARFRVLNPDGSPFIDEWIEARWSSSAEPRQNGQFQPAVWVTGRARDVHAHWPETIPLLVKWEGEDAAYVASGLSYQKGDYKVPKWRLPTGTYRVQVILEYGAEPRDFWLCLENKGRRIEDVKIASWT